MGKPITTPNPESEIKLTEERILEAASRCSQTENVLRILFPEVFKKKHYEPEEYEIVKVSNGAMSGPRIFIEKTKTGFYTCVNLGEESKFLANQSYSTTDWNQVSRYQGFIVNISKRE